MNRPGHGWKAGLAALAVSLAAGCHRDDRIDGLSQARIESGPVRVLLREGYDGMPGVDGGVVNPRTGVRGAWLYAKHAKLDREWLLVDPNDGGWSKSYDWLAIPIGNVLAVYPDDRRVPITNRTRTFRLDDEAVANAFDGSWRDWVNVQSAASPSYQPAMSLGAGKERVLVTRPDLRDSGNGVIAVFDVADANEPAANPRWTLLLHFDQTPRLMTINATIRRGTTTTSLASPAGNDYPPPPVETLVATFIEQLAIAPDAETWPDSLRSAPAVLERLIPVIASRLERDAEARRATD